MEQSSKQKGSLKPDKMKLKNTILLTTTILSFAAFGQEEVHECAKKHLSKPSHGHEKTLTVNEELEANKYDVHYYKLDLAMTNLNTSVAGTAEMHAKTVDNLDSVVLELYPSLVISDLRMNGVSTPYNRTNSVLKVPINAVADYSFIMEIDYAGTPPTPVQNPFGGSAVTSTYVSTMTNRITYTISCPFLAHEWFPCKQILRDKVDSSSVFVTVPSSCKAGSNGVLDNVVDLGNGTTRYEWNHRHPIMYYLICASIAPYTEYNVYAHPSQMAGDSVLVQNYIYGNGTTLPTITTQCDLVPQFLELYSDLYGLYPFSNEKYGQCVAPLGGGMEHQTMTTIGVFEKKITAHELSHSWFGDHVGIASFSDVWVSEGFATYSEYLMLENYYPAERASLLSGWHNTVMSAYGGSVWHTDTLDVARIYNSRLTYKKGASILNTLRHIVNDDILFFQSLENFQTDFHDSVAVGLDVKETFETTTGLDLTNFFQEWYFGEGYPTYSTRWNSLGNDLILEINHSTSMPAVTPTFTNPVEIKFSRNGMSDTTVRFDVYSNSSQFYIPNIGTITDVLLIDPNNWIINKIGTNVQDLTFVATLEEQPENVQVSVYPNPADGITSIEVFQPGEYDLNIYDQKGKLILNKKFENSTEIDFESFNSGSYVIEIRSKSNNDFVIRRIIKK